MGGARVSSGKASKQDYATPREFIDVVERVFEPLTFDLAAHSGNSVTPRWFGPDGEAEDSLVQPWHKLAGLLWLNPPFRHIGPWAEKCADEAKHGANVLLLVPASLGANWYAKHVAQNALSLVLNGRLSFDGVELYPKDCLLARFGPTVRPSLHIFKWRSMTFLRSWRFLR